MSRTVVEQSVIGRREFLTPREFAEIIGISERHAYNLTQSGQVASVRLGKPVRIPVSEIERLKAEARRVGA